MAIPHRFLSSKGDLLPRWRDAFTSATCGRLGDKVSRGGTTPMVWVHLPEGVPATQVLEQVRAAYANSAIVAMSDQPGDEEALECFSAGARGYCNAHAAAELLLRVAEVVQQGGLWIGESLMQRLLQGTARIPAPSSQRPLSNWTGLLTERERQVALAVAEGASNKEVARLLGITERTVKAHTGAIFEKLAVRDRLQLSLIIHGHQRH